MRWIKVRKFLNFAPYVMPGIYIIFDSTCILFLQSNVFIFYCSRVEEQQCITLQWKDTRRWWNC